MKVESNMRDPSMDQTAAGLSTTHGIDGNVCASQMEIRILRNLAKKVANLSSRPIEQEKTELWTRHNDLEKTRPLIFCDPENGWNEIIPQDKILCEKSLFRVWEMALRKEIFWAEEMQDDRVIEPYFNIPWHYQETGYGVNEEEKQEGGEKGSYKYICHIKDYEKDFYRLKYPEIIVDHKRTGEIRELAENILGDILQVRIKGVWWWTLGMTWDFIKIRGLENLMTDILVYPEWILEFLSV